MAEFGFGAPSKEEEYIYGAQRPGFPGKFVQRQMVDEWVAFMKKQGVSRIVCLLSEEELGYYPTLTGGLLGVYAEVFGPDNVLWAPTADKRLLSAEAVHHICYFLHASAVQGNKTVVHCSAGLGRTGQAVAAWLVFHWNLSERKAIKTVEELNRSPMEAVFYRNAGEADLLKVLGVARELDKPD
ncbi:MAG: dual specificity protein phosphatase family protein [Dehalococcoidia bacterium]|nr:dual specificity protein phosphatase family protein [Dehalococcoidia bacterium]